MPYKDKEKQREVKRKSAAKRRAAQKEKEQESRIAISTAELEDGFGNRPTMEDTEVAYLNAERESIITEKVVRHYGKSRTWGCIMYVDSAPSDWEDQLRMIGVGFAVSPLHDKDITATGDLKKAHWHVILDWRAGSTTYATAFGIARGVLRGTIPIPLVSPRGYYRYFTHLDNPKKAQYDSDDIITGNGFDVGDFLELTAQEKSALRRKIIEEIIIPLDILEYWDLLTYTMFNCDTATFDYVATNTIMFQGALGSRRHCGK